MIKNKFKHLVFKCTLFNKLGHTEPFSFAKLIGLKGNTYMPLKLPNVPKPKNIWVPKVKI